MEELLKVLGIDDTKNNETIVSELERKQVEYLERLENVEEQGRKEEIRNILKNIEEAIDVLSWLFPSDKESVLQSASTVAPREPAAQVMPKAAAEPIAMSRPEVKQAEDANAVVEQTLKQNVAVEQTLKQNVAVEQAPKQNIAVEQNVEAEQNVVIKTTSTVPTDIPKDVTAGNSAENTSVKKKGFKAIVEINKKELVAVKELITSVITERDYKVPLIIEVAAIVLLQILFIL